MTSGAWAAVSQPSRRTARADALSDGSSTFLGVIALSCRRRNLVALLLLARRGSGVSSSGTGRDPLLLYGWLGQISRILIACLSAMSNRLPFPSVEGALHAQSHDAESLWPLLISFGDEVPPAGLPRDSRPALARWTRCMTRGKCFHALGREGRRCTPGSPTEHLSGQ